VDSARSRAHSRYVEVPLVAIVSFRGGKLADENIYWDQASVLKQTGLLSGDGLPAHGAETAHKVLDLQTKKEVP
jgi:carboxymethylenebutenolidase